MVYNLKREETSEDCDAACSSVICEKWQTVQFHVFNLLSAYTGFPSEAATPRKLREMAC